MKNAEGNCVCRQGPYYMVRTFQIIGEDWDGECSVEYRVFDQDDNPAGYDGDMVCAAGVCKITHLCYRLCYRPESCGPHAHVHAGTRTHHPSARRRRLTTAPLPTPSLWTGPSASPPSCCDYMTTAPHECTGLTCSEGYAYANMQPLVYSAGAQPGDEVQVSGCEPKACAAYNFGVGLTGGSTDGCTDPITLDIEDQNCWVECKPGYSAAPGSSAAGQIQCLPSDGTLNTLQTSAAPTCQENTCVAFNFNTGVVGDDDHATAPACQDGVQLQTHTGNRCAVKCDNGYDSGDAIITCENAAWNNKPPVGDLTCNPSVCETPAGHTTGDPPHPGRVVTGCTNMRTGDTDGCDVSCMQGYFISSHTDGAKICSADVGNGASFKGVPECTACPAGRYGYEAGTASCVECSVGQYSGAAAAVGCTNCEAGRFETSAEASGCRPCPEGRYQADVAQTACKGCETGTYGPNAGATSLADCAYCLEGPIGGARRRGVCRCAPASSRSQPTSCAHACVRAS